MLQSATWERGLRGARLGTEDWILVPGLLHCSVTLNKTLGLRFPFTRRGGVPLWDSQGAQTDGACVPAAYLSLASNEPGTEG